MKDYLTHMSGRIKERVKPLASVGEKNTRDKNNPVYEYISTYVDIMGLFLITGSRSDSCTAFPGP